MAKSIDEKLAELVKNGVNEPLPEDGSKLNLSDFTVEKSPSLRNYTITDPKTGNPVGVFPYGKARLNAPDIGEVQGAKGSVIDLPGHITMDYPFLEPEYRGRGLGDQMYKHIEKETGQTIYPDLSLTEASSNLHERKGLGKDFGSSNYKPDIIKAIQDKLSNVDYDDLGNFTEPSPDVVSSRSAHAEKLYDVLKKRMSFNGLKSFKSVAPILGKTALVAGTGGLSLMAEAAAEGMDSEEAGDSNAQAAFDRDSDAHKQLKKIEGTSVPDHVKIKALELFKKNRLPY